MKISDRLTDYLVIGGFFWTMQFALLLLTLSPPERATQLKNLATLIATIPDKAIVPFTALLGALGLIAVFTTGVFIDLLGSFYFRAVEVSAFKVHAQANVSWMQQFATRYKDYIQEDWSTVLAAPGFKEGLGVGFRGLMFWNRKAIAEQVDNIKRAWVARKSYVRMHSFLLSWISLVGGADKIELLNTQLSLWSVSRAVATTLGIAIIEWAFLYQASIRALERAGFTNPTFIAVLVGIIPYGLLLSAIGVGRAAYSRLCGTLFALCYVASKKIEAGPECSTQRAVE